MIITDRIFGWFAWTFFIGVCSYILFVEVYEPWAADNLQWSMKAGVYKYDRDVCRADLDLMRKTR
jgi:hypothetical protein